MNKQHFNHYSEARSLFTRWPNFTAWEIACHAPSRAPDDRGELLVVPEALDKLQALRTAWAKPLDVKSGYRTPEHNAQVSSTGHDGPHTRGVAFDLKCDGGDIIQLAAMAYLVGFSGFGLAPEKGFLHVDTLNPRCWSYK